MRDNTARRLFKLINYRNEIGYFWKLRELCSRSTGLKHYYYTYLYYNYTRRFGAEIPLSCDLSPTIVFPHGINGVFISSGALIGNRVVIFQQVTIGSNTLKDSARIGCPIIGNDVYIGAGAKVVGQVSIGDSVRIGANCVVAQDVPKNSTIVLGQPRMICHENTRDNGFYPLW